MQEITKQHHTYYTPYAQTANIAFFGHHTILPRSINQNLYTVFAG